MRLLAVACGVACLVLAGAVVFWLSGLNASVATLPDNSPVLDSEGRNKEGEYAENPFAAAKGSAVPKLEVAQTTFDFGIMKFPLKKDASGKDIGDSYTFVIKNVGDAVLKLARGPSTCQCTLSSLEGETVEVPPGGSTDVKVEWTPTMMADPFEKSASIWTNDPALFATGSESADGKITLTVKGRVLEGYAVDPSLISLGTISETEPTKFQAVVYSVSTADLQIAVKQVTSEFITAEIVPVEPEKLKERSALSGWYVHGLIHPKLPIGRINETLTLSSNDESKPEAEIKIEARRQGPVSIAGRFWNDAYTMVDFKRFEAAKGIETTLSLYTAKQEPPLELNVSEIKPAGLEVTAERDAAYADPVRERHLIKVKVPAGRPPERLVNADAGRVIVTTNIAEVPALKFHLVYESY